MSPGRQGEPGRVTGSRDFVRFWVADGVSNLGTFVSTLALQLLLIDTLHADQRAIGLVRSAQWLPYLLFGLLAGVVVDRVRRRPLLVVADLVSAALLGAVGLLALTGRLSVPLLAGLVFLSGSASMFFVAAHQSYLPALVPLRLLPTASARLEQTWTAAQSVGPLVGGVLVRLLSAPVAVLVDANSRSAAELMPAALQEARRALVVGALTAASVSTAELRSTESTAVSSFSKPSSGSSSPCSPLRRSSPSCSAECSGTGCPDG